MLLSGVTQTFWLCWWCCCCCRRKEAVLHEVKLLGPNGQLRRARRLRLEHVDISTKRLCRYKNFKEGQDSRVYKLGCWGIDIEPVNIVINSDMRGYADIHTCTGFKTYWCAFLHSGC